MSFWNRFWGSGGAGGAVLSVFGRTGAVVAHLADYLASQISNDSGVVGATVKDALETLSAAILSYFVIANTTITVKATGGDFTTIQDAWDSLKSKRINPDVSVTITVDPGSFVQTSALFLRHPNGDRIFIAGSTPASSTLTGFVSATGAAANWTVTLNVADTTGMSTGDYAILKALTGTGSPKAVEGFWEVLNVPSSTQIVLKATNRTATFPTMTITGGTIIVEKTLIKANGCDGIQIAGPVGGLYNIGIIGNGTAYDGININQRGTFYANHVVFLGVPGNTNFVGINGFGRYGLADTCTAQTAIAYGMVISNVTEFGFYFYSGSMMIAQSCISSGNGKIGFYAVDGSKATWYSCYAHGNAQTGFYAYNASAIMAQYSEAWCNVYSGFQAVGGGFIDARNAKACNNGYHGFNASSFGGIYASSSTSTGNGSGGSTYYGYYATNGGMIRADSSTFGSNTNGDYKADQGSTITINGVSGSPVCSPAVDVVGNGNALIKGTTATPVTNGENVVIVGYADTTIANASAETTLIPASIRGSATLLANFFAVGQTLKIKAAGYISSIASPGNITIKIKLGSTVIVATATVAIGASLSNMLFEIEALITCRSVGSSGTVIGQGKFLYIDDPDVIVVPMVATSTATINTTGTLALDITEQWSAADPGNTITLTNLIVEKARV